VIARTLLAALTLALGFIAADSAAQRPPARSAVVGDVRMSELPPEARETLELIRKAGPFPYAKDGALFGNREGALPSQKRGYYREYTVKTPHVRNRGGRRIIWGAGGEYYYTADHYTTFRRIRE
jgi:ribonuclease T1